MSSNTLSAILERPYEETVPAVRSAHEAQVAHEALHADPSTATVLPRNAAVRALDDHATVVDAFDLAAMTKLQ